MFETKIQYAWEHYNEDFGLGRIVLFIAFFNTFLFFVGIFGFGEIVIQSLLPVILAFTFLSFRSAIVRLRRLYKLLINLIPMTVAISFNYYLIGVLDRRFGHLERLDPIFVGIEYWLFNSLVANAVENFFGKAGVISTVLYDLMMMSYMLYFFLPFLGVYLYWKYLPGTEKYKIGRFCGSVVIFYCLNNLLYLAFPVTGPQYYIEYYNYSQLPLSDFGFYLYELVRENHTTHIDCFPSGHFGMAVLILVWLYRMKHPFLFAMEIIAGLIMFATLAMRYHYAIDLIAAIPLAFLSYYLGKVLIPSAVHVNYFRSKSH